MLRVLKWTRKLADHGFALLMLALAARFAWAALQDPSSLARDARGSLETTAQPTPQAPPEQAEALAAAEPAKSAFEGVPGAGGNLVQTQLTVTHGKKRSQVFVNDALVGQTAFVGDMTCRLGSDVTVRIVPKRGKPVEHVRPCDGMRITIAE